MLQYTVQKQNIKKREKRKEIKENIWNDLKDLKFAFTQNMRKMITLCSVRAEAISHQIHLAEVNTQNSIA